MSIEDKTRSATLNICDEYADILDRCFARLSNSPTARSMIHDALRSDWTFMIDDQGSYDFHMDSYDQLISLNSSGLSAKALGLSDHFQNSLLLSMVRALRDVWQENRHGGSHEHYAPEQVLMVERVRAADCDVIAALVAWELRSAGDVGLWRHLIGSEDGDVAMALSGHIERNPHDLSVHEALRAAFNQWYRSEERVRSCDHETLNYMDSLMEDFSEEDVFGAQRLQPIGVEVFSCLPDKTAYLQAMGREIMMDPFYSGLDDEINQAHFAQILHDLRVTYVEGVPFRDKNLAAKIFPDSI